MLYSFLSSQLLGISLLLITSIKQIMVLMPSDNFPQNQLVSSLPVGRSREAEIPLAERQDVFPLKTLPTLTQGTNCISLINYHTIASPVHLIKEAERNMETKRRQANITWTVPFLVLSFTRFSLRKLRYRCHLPSHMGEFLCHLTKLVLNRH